MSLLLADQKRAVRQWVFDALTAAGKPIPLERIARSPQDAAGLVRPYVLLVDTGSARRGPAPERRSRGDHGAATHYSYNVATSTVSIVIVGSLEPAALEDEPQDYVAQLEPMLWEPDIDTVLRDAGLSVNAVTVIPNAASRLTGQSQWERRAALDVTFNHVTVATSTPGTVSEAEVTGTTDPPSPIGTFTVGAP